MSRRSRTWKRRARVVSLGWLLLGLMQAPVAPVRAQESVLETFRLHWDLAMRLYRSERYEEALEEMHAAYAIKADPRLLLNMGHAHMRCRRPAEALRDYRRYRETVPNLSPQDDLKMDEYVGKARALEAELSQDLLVRQVPTPPPAPAPLPVYRRWWFWTAVGAAAAVGAAGVALAVTQPWQASSVPTLPPGVPERNGDPLNMLGLLRFGP